MAGVARDPASTFWRQLEDYERRLRALERSNPPTTTYRGPRSDLPSGVGTRAEGGLTASGRFGFRVYGSNGVLTYDFTTP